MNYLAHAYLARLENAAPEFALGAMLPDLANLVGVRLPPLVGVLSEGIRFHHRSDAVFHSSREFQTEQVELVSCFTTSGLRRGPARALAHLGLEFLFDAALANRADGYADAISVGAIRSDLWVELPFEMRQKFMSLCGYLELRGLSNFEADPERFIMRLGRTLEGRQRLAPTANELSLAVSELMTRAPRWNSFAPLFADALHSRLKAENWQGDQNHPS